MSQGVWTGRLRRPRRSRADTPPTLPSVSPYTEHEDSDSEEAPPPPSFSQKLVETLSGLSVHNEAAGCSTSGAASASAPVKATGAIKEPRTAAWHALAGYDAEE